MVRLTEFTSTQRAHGATKATGGPTRLVVLVLIRIRGRRPELLIESAVKGMVPHNRLGRTVLKKLFVYGGAEHPHVAQQPEAVKIR